MHQVMRKLRCSAPSTRLKFCFIFATFQDKNVDEIENFVILQKTTMTAYFFHKHNSWNISREGGSSEINFKNNRYFEITYFLNVDCTFLAAKKPFLVSTSIFKICIWFFDDFSFLHISKFWWKWIIMKISQII